MGQNIRLASEVTGYSIDAIKKSDYELSESETIYLEDIDGITEHSWKLLYSYGIETTEEFISTPREELLNIKGLGEKTLDKIEPLIVEAHEKRVAEVEAARAAAKAQREAAQQNSLEALPEFPEEEDDEVELSDDDIVDDLSQEEK
jgi:N utilization substance protein A